MPASTSLIAITVRDAKSGSVPTGARVWIDGSEQVVSNGVVSYSIQLDPKTGNPSKANVWGWVQADGYERKSFTVVSQTGSYGSGVVNLNPTASVLAHDLSIQIFPQPLSGVEITVTGESLQSPKTVMTSVGTATASSLLPGTYHITASKPTYKTVEQDVVMPDDRNLGLRMELEETDGEEAATAEDPEEGGGAAEDVDFDSLVSAAAPPLMTSDTFEQVYGNNAFDGYYTSAQARVYIGNLFIDEMQSVQFAAQANIVPIYGYASRLADAYAEGKSLVQGQLVLNYVSPAYLFTVLEAYKHNEPEAELTEALKEGRDLARVLAAKQTGLLTSLFSSEKLETAISRYAESPEAIREAKRKLRSTGFDPVYLNAVYQRVRFDMTIEIGADQETSTYRRLEACRIVSNEQIFDQSGNVIGDAFGFVARRAR